MQLTIVNHSKARIPRKFLAEWVATLSTQPKLARQLKGKELVVAFLDEKPARKLNKQFRGKDYATDVLSFGSEGDPESLGELVICPQVIVRQAKEHGLLVKEELAYMVLHGILHLLGYDHELSEKDAKAMFRLQDALFEKLIV
jgi:probable rRNA maturation factor